MPALNAQLPTPERAAFTSNYGGRSGILETREIQVTSEYAHFDVNIEELIRIPIINEPWKSCFVPTDAIERNCFNWVRISVPGIFAVGKCYNDQFYEVAVCRSYIPWLRDHELEFQLDLDFDRAKPSHAESQVYGILRAKTRAQARFLQNATSAIWSGGGQEFVSYYRRIIPSKLEIPLEWVILNYDVLIRKQFVKLLQLISLLLIRDYSTPIIFELLAKDEHELLQIFRRYHTDFLKSNPTCSQQSAELHLISLLRYLLVLSGGKDDVWQREFDPKNSANINASTYSSLVGFSGSRSLRSFDSQAMLDKPSELKIFASDEICELDVGHSTRRMIDLPIGFPQGYLNLVLYELSEGQCMRLLYVAYPRNNGEQYTGFSYLELSSSRPTALYFHSTDGQNLYQRLIGDLRSPHITEQVALTLAALLCFKRLLPYSSDDTMKSFNGDYLADFDTLLRGEPLVNERAMLEHMLFSFLRAVDTLGNDHQGIRQLLATVLGKAISARKPCDKFLDQYWICRMKTQSHGEALIKCTEPKLLLVWYYFSAAVLSMSVLLVLELSLALKFLFFPTFEDFYSLSEYIRLHRSIQRSNRWTLLAYASLCSLRFIVIYISVLDSRLVIEISGFPFSSALLWTLYAIQGILHIRSSTATSLTHPCSYEMQDLEKAIHADMGNRVPDSETLTDFEGCQYIRNGTSTEFYRGFNYESYKIIRLFNIGDRLPEEIPEKLDKVGDINQVPSVLELPDESWEIVVLKSYL